MCLTAHFIDKDWVLHKRILNFCHITIHKGENLAECISNCLLDWKLENVFTITVDNASSNNVAVFALSKKLDMWGTNVMDGKHLYVRCMAHILNLIVQDGLKEIGPSIKKVEFILFDVRDDKKIEKVFDRFDLYDDNFNSYLSTDVWKYSKGSKNNLHSFDSSGSDSSNSGFPQSLNTNTLRNKLHMKKKSRDCGSIRGKRLVLFVLKKIWSFLRNLNLGQVMPPKSKVHSAIWEHYEVIQDNEENELMVLITYLINVLGLLSIAYWILISLVSGTDQILQKNKADTGQKAGRSSLIEDGALTWIVQNSNKMADLLNDQVYARDMISRGALWELIRISGDFSRDDIKSLARQTLTSSLTSQAECNT
ncbi:Armadillo repeat-containing kinesin-like protein 2 [Capsicum baccatum]|uniref:Armadillo repeat-containing kinesin-like protein 2 n=1 Tax=Capsicum baccatum TaxID=33114 RepID=A0A2G2VU53_CAPBA|nr:Armadillo repeat-containing kinesin-like protein 2 [Capsicum baccatum]